MRYEGDGTKLHVRAVAGLHVVMLAWDFKKKLTLNGAALPAPLAGLLGFAIERTEYAADGTIFERYMLRGIKRFRNKDKGLAAGTPVPLDEHPIQSFQWADYTVKPNTRYDYRVVPMYGKPKLLTPSDVDAVTLAVTTEAEQSDGTGPRHDIYFNRGVIGSQAFSREFPDDEPDPSKPSSAPMKWLSRGLFEALLGFIARAKNDDYSLHCAFYELRYAPVATALAAARERGVEVCIVYDAESSYKAENEQTLKKAHLFVKGVAFPRTVTEGIRHNKFIVLSKKGTPVAVWTGSTNISAGGIFGHSNVGHAVWDEDVASAYREYWERLAEPKNTPTKLRAPNRDATPTPRAKPPKNSITPLFSARDDKGSLDTLQWYADRMAEAKKLVCFTVAFNLDEVFQDVIKQENDVLRYIVKDDDLSANETIGRDRDVLFAAGSRLDAGALANFLGERDNPLNSNDYIHTKVMLVDPLGADPLVVTGSANFSRPSQQTNDENMLVIRGDKRVADIYFGEFFRVFDHHYTRYTIRRLADAADPGAGYLKDQAEDWVRPHFDPTSHKAKRRTYFTDVAV